MRAEIVRFALDRIPLSLIIDDSTLLVNLNYFWMRDRNLVDGQNRRWEDIPLVHPESFTREFAEFCLTEGVRGKFSVAPCPAGLARLDHGLPMFSAAQQASWLAMCRETIVPAFDITPEMLTHSWVLDLDTFQPRADGIWEQYEWETLPTDQEDLVLDYIRLSCRILANIGLPPEGVTSPGGFGGRTLALYARLTGQAVREVTGNPTPYFFKRVEMGEAVETPVWYADRVAGTAVGEIIASTGDWTGSWTGYGEVDADRYLTADLTHGRVADLVRARQPVVLCSHWQGFYGLHNEDRRGLRTLTTVVRRMRALDPRGEWTRWRKCSEITNYACAREMARMVAQGNTVALDLPVLVPELTLRLSGARAAEVLVDGRALRPAATRAAFGSGTFLADDDGVLIAFDPAQRRTTVEVIAPEQAGAS